MAVETVRVRVSDKSGQEIPDGTGARVRVMYPDDRPDLRADLTDAEVTKLIKEYKLVETTPRPDRKRSR